MADWPLRQPPVMRISSATTRASIGIADQLFYSFTNFALTVLVARSSSRPEFGAYSLVAAIYLIGLALIRGLTSETLIVRFTAKLENVWRQGAKDAGGAAVVVAAVFSVALVIVGAFLSGSLARTTIVFGLLFPGLVFQDYLRFAALSLGRPLIALLSDLCVVVTLFPAAGVLIATGHASSASLVAAWGLAAHVGAVVAAVVLRLPPLPTRVARWFAAQHAWAVRYGADDLASQGSQQGSTFAVAAMSGLSDAGALRGAQTVFGPTAIVSLGVQAAVTPELVRLRHRSLRSMGRAAFGVGLALSLISILWGVAALASPDTVGRALFGPTWTTARPLILFFAIAQAGVGLSVGPIVGLRALGAANRTLRTRIIVVSAGFAVSLVGAALSGARGVAISRAVVNPAQFLIWQWQFRRAMTDAPLLDGTDPQADPVSHRAKHRKHSSELT